MELIVKEFSHLNLKDNEVYLLGDFNPIQDGRFWNCSWMGVGGGGRGVWQKSPPSIKSVTHILQGVKYPTFKYPTF